MALAPSLVKQEVSGQSLLRLALDDARWTRFVAEHPDTLAYHLPAWSEVIQRSYGARLFVVAVAGQDGELVAGIPVAAARRFKKTSWVSLPYSDVCPPLGDVAGVEALVGALEREVARGDVAGIEIRSPLPGSRPRRSLRGVTHTLTLSPDAEQVLGTFSKSQVQRNIVRARREGVVVRPGERSEDLLESFLGLHLETRRRQGLPIQPRAFFEHLWERVIEPGHGFVLLALVEGVPAAAAVFLLGRRVVTYKYGASAADAWPKRPNHLLFWEAIRWSVENDYCLFDFGRSDFGSDGLRAFKGGWGTKETELAYSTIGAMPIRPLAPLATAVQPVLRRAPRQLSIALGRALYRFAG